jgi:CDP-glycerol glycerophosphotransferase (TagB/SpsB family)
VDEDRILLVATKYAQMGSAFAALVEATRDMAAVRVVVKCHPAETPAPYVRDAAGASHVVVADASRDLAALLAVSAAVVTVNSTVAIDAMVVGVPSVVVALPNNLSPFVEAGVMTGAGRDVAGIRAALSAVLDGDAALATRDRIRTFTARYHISADGQAAVRAAQAITALRPTVGRETGPDLA